MCNENKKQNMIVFEIEASCGREECIAPTENLHYCEVAEATQAGGDL